MAYKTFYKAQIPSSKPTKPAGTPGVDTNANQTDVGRWNVKADLFQFPETDVTTTTQPLTGLLSRQLEYSATLELSSNKEKVKYKTIGRFIHF